MSPKSERLQVVDALRGFAIISIMLLHNIEHFDFYYFPESLPAWMKSMDHGIWDTLFFLFGGKSYAIFALLFGLTFSIQSANQEGKGKDFRGRFAWRLVLLFGFGLLNSTFYQGDILMIYAILGFCLLPVAKLSNRWVLGIALLLMLQPFQWHQVLQGIQDPARKMSDPASWGYFAKSSDYLSKGSLLDTWLGNLTNGRAGVMLWTWEMGRVFQTCSLFMLGMLAGRLSLFSATNETRVFWRRVLLWASICFVLLFGLGRAIPAWITSESIKRPLGSIEGSLTNVAFMLILVSGFTLLYQRRSFHRLLDSFSPIGRMSLSNYILQSFAGTVLYYGFGFGLFKYTGATYCLLIGLALAYAQWHFSRWWLRQHKQGPLETLWHKATWIGAE